MGYFQVRFNSRVVIYDHRGFIRLATDAGVDQSATFSKLFEYGVDSRYGYLPRHTSEFLHGIYHLAG